MTATGERQIEILHAVRDGEWYDATGQGAHYKSCMRLHDQGFLRRDPKDPYRFAISDKGREFLRKQGAA